MTTKIDCSQVSEIVVKDLLSKYKYNLGNTNKSFVAQEWCSAFKKVLSYYLTEDELEKYLAQKEI